jgi:hypothetical protein
MISFPFKTKPKKHERQNHFLDLMFHANLKFFQLCIKSSCIQINQTIKDNLMCNFIV